MKNFSTPLKRALGYAIDWYLSYLLIIFVLTIANLIKTGQLTVTSSITGYSTVMTIILLIICYAVNLCYFLLPQWINKKNNGKSVGKIVTKCHVEMINGMKIDLKSLIVRYLLGVLIIEGAFSVPATLTRVFISEIAGTTVYFYISTLFIIISIGSIICLFISKRKQMLHDYIAATVVVDDQPAQ